MPDIKKQLDQIIWDKWSKGKKFELKSSGLGWSQDVMPWKAEFKRNITSNQPFIYRAEGRYISFKPTGLWWTTPQGQSVIKQRVNPSVGSLAKGKVKYANALGTGIGLEASVSRTTWRKEVIIDSLVALGSIPADAEFLEIGFEIETDFDIEGWDKKSELKFNTAIKLSELSQLESVKVWDNHIVPEPKEGEEPQDPFERCDGFLRVVDGRYYLVKRIPVNYLKQAVYPIITDTVISFGSEYEFNAAYTGYIACAELDSTHFVVGYTDVGDLSHGKARIGVVTGNTIAYGSEYTFRAASTVRISCAALDATHFVVGYRANTSPFFGHAKIGVVSNGDEIAYGSEYTFNAAVTGYISCAALDSTHFVVTCQDDGGDDYGIAKIGVVSGNAIAFGSEYEFNAAYTTYISCAALDSTHFVVVCMDDGGDDYGIAKIGVVSGNAIAFGSEYTFNTARVPGIACAALDATHFVVVYYDLGGDNYGKAKIGVVSGNAIAFGSEDTFNTAGTGWLSCTALDSTHFVVIYQDIGDFNNGKAIIGVVSGGDGIASGSEYEFNAASTWYTSCAALGTLHFVVAYRDDGGDDYGIARIGEIPLALPTVTTQAVDGIGFD